jgi:hypothetical protein
MPAKPFLPRLKLPDADEDPREWLEASPVYGSPVLMIGVNQMSGDKDEWCGVHLDAASAARLAVYLHRWVVEANGGALPEEGER